MRAGTEQWRAAGNQGTFMLYGKRVGLLGYGNLAHALMPLLAPFGCPIGGYDPWLSAGYLHRQRVEALSLDQLMATSQIIFVLAAPSTENQALLSRALLEQIQVGAVLVVISRAHMVDFDALTDLVLAGRFKAAIDVFPTEPLASITRCARRLARCSRRTVPARSGKGCGRSARWLWTILRPL
jgi:phosphoglycerate dehydrogenase-like enzyme